MRSPLTLCALALAMVAWTAPSHAAAYTRTNGLKVQEEKTEPKDKPQALKNAEVDWQVIAVRKKGVDRCPEVPGWNSEDNWLIQTLRPPSPPPPDEGFGDKPSTLEPRGASEKVVEELLRKAIAADPLLRDLDRFCAYRKQSDSVPDFPNPPPAGLKKAENSRMALVAAGESGLGQAGDTALANHFITQASEMEPNQTAVLPPSDNRRPVRLVFIDTQPDGEGVPHASGPSRHGYTLVHLADQLICHDADSCPVEFATLLALPYSRFDPQQPPLESSSPGGNLGFVDELAAAIVQAVWNWRLSDSKQHLVLNLSVGWDGELLGEFDKRRISLLRLDAQLVYKALQYARRSNALVIAAVGNRRGGGTSNWPLLPAAWELQRPSVLPFAIGPKPVYAVGGVDWQGLPLPNYRIGGLPRRVAFGDHAVVPTVASYQPTAMYTGSSVSTAVVSSIAAEVWHLRPDLGPAEVMRLITQSGDVLPGRADYYAWKNLWPLSHLLKAPHMRRLSLCQAVAQAYLTGEGRYSIPRCVPWDAKSGAADLRPLGLSTTATSIPELKAATLPAVCQSASHPTPRLFAVKGQSVPDSCPLHLLPDMVSQRWVAPQPDDPPCPGCSLIPPQRVAFASLAIDEVPEPPLPQGYVLAIAIDPKWSNPTHSIESAALDIDCYSGHGKFFERRTYAIPRDDLMKAATGGHRLLLKEVGNGSLAGCTATLNFKVTVRDPDDSKKEPITLSVQNPVYVSLPDR